MTREEFRAVVEAVLDQPRTIPGREDTIMRAADAYAHPRPRLLMRGDTAPHQIRLTVTQGNHDIAVSCTCRALPTGRNGITDNYEPLETRSRWDAHEAQAVYRAHLPELSPEPRETQCSPS